MKKSILTFLLIIITILSYNISYAKWVYKDDVSPEEWNRIEENYKRRDEELKKKAEINLTFNRYHFQLFANYYDIKNNPKFCYINTIGEAPKYSYSIQTIDFIVEEIKKDPDNIINNLKNKLNKKS